MIRQAAAVLLGCLLTPTTGFACCFTPGGGSGPLLPYVMGVPPSTPGCMSVWNNTAASALVDCASKQITQPWSWPSTFQATDPTDIFSINIGAFPASGHQLDAGVLEGFVAKMNIPANPNVGSTRQDHPNTGFASYILNGKTVPGNSATSYFGFSGSTADMANPYGYNQILTNTDALNQATGGHNYAYMIGEEMDLQTVPLSGANPHPAGFQAAYLAQWMGIAGAEPQGGSFGFFVREGIANGCCWTYAFASDDNTASIGLHLGAETHAQPSQSQPIQFTTREATGTNQDNRLWVDTGDNLEYVPQDNRGAISTTGHFGSAGTAGVPTVDNCGSSPTLSGASDTKGLITVGSGGGGGCHIVFAAQFARTPACVFTTSLPSVVPAISEIGPGDVTVNFSASLAGGSFTYICFQ